MELEFVFTRRRYRRAGAEPECIVVLSPAGKRRRKNPAAAIRHGWRDDADRLNREMDVETAVENPPVDTHCQERPPADAPRFAAAAGFAGSPAARVPGKVVCALDPTHAATLSVSDGSFPRRKAAAIFQRQLWSKARPASPPTIATPAKRSACAAAKHPRAPAKMFCHNPRAARDWNKTPAGHERPGRWLWPDHCREECCAGSASRPGRSGDSAAA